VEALAGPTAARHGVHLSIESYPITDAASAYRQGKIVITV
jgi:hypothetical protein